MAFYGFTDNFKEFFSRLNPSLAFERLAASEHKAITDLIEDPTGRAAALSPKCFLQGSYKHDTAIYTINDVDIVALCDLVHPPANGTGGRSWGRHEIFDTIAAPLLADNRYKNKVYYNQQSMCIKLDLGIKVEILPVVYAAAHHPDHQKEPFRLFRPETGKWEDGHARHHKAFLTAKNKRTGGNFIPAIKVFKHLRSAGQVDAVSFHLECLLYFVPDEFFAGGPAEYIPAILGYISKYSADLWYGTDIKTPCGERSLFTATEWAVAEWRAFHQAVVVWSRVAAAATNERDQARAIKYWQILLGEELFPARVLSHA